MTTCGTCGLSYGGTKTEHCMACHETFAGAESGDSHRIGIPGHTEGPDRRRCRTSTEMIAGGMWTTVNASGTIIWHGRITKNRQARRRPDNWPGADTQNDGQPPTHTQVPPEKTGPQNGTGAAHDHDWRTTNSIHSRNEARSCAVCGRIKRDGD